MLDAASLRRQADAGDPRAQVSLARALLKGRHPPLAEVTQLVREACAQKSADALLLHAALAALGLGQPQNLDKALHALRQAAALGDAGAQGQLAALGGTIDVGVWFARSEERR